MVFKNTGLDSRLHQQKQRAILRWLHGRGESRTGRRGDLGDGGDLATAAIAVAIAVAVAALAALAAISEQDLPN